MKPWELLYNVYRLRKAIYFTLEELVLYQELVWIAWETGIYENLNISNRRIMGFMDCDERAAIKHRQALIDKGLIKFAKGHKGLPSSYSLLPANVSRELFDSTNGQSEKHRADIQDDIPENSLNKTPSNKDPNDISKGNLIKPAYKSANMSVQNPAIYSISKVKDNDLNNDIDYVYDYGASKEKDDGLARLKYGSDKAKIEDSSFDLENQEKIFSPTENLENSKGFKVKNMGIESIKDFDNEYRLINTIIGELKQQNKEDFRDTYSLKDIFENIKNEKTLDRLMEAKSVNSLPLGQHARASPNLGSFNFDQKVEIYQENGNEQELDLCKKANDASEEANTCYKGRQNSQEVDIYHKFGGNCDNESLESSEIYQQIKDLAFSQALPFKSRCDIRAAKILVETYGLDLISRAIDTLYDADSQKRNWRYVRGIARNMQNEEGY